MVRQRGKAEKQEHRDQPRHKAYTAKEENGYQKQRIGTKKRQGQARPEVMHFAEPATS
jgi:hypothetical protein